MTHNNTQAIPDEMKLATIAQIFTMGVVLLCLGWIVFHTIDAVPSFDDFCFGANARERGVINNVIARYQEWDGRFTATLLIGAFTSSQLFLNYYPLAAFLTLILILFAAHQFLRFVGLKDLTVLIAFFFVVVSSFSFTESVFWASGAISYGIGSSILLILIVQEIKIVTGEIPPSFSSISTCAVSSILFAGIGETVMVAHIGFLLAMFAYLIIKRSDTRTVVSIGIILLSAIIGAIVVKLAPGNVIRAARFAPQDIWEAFEITTLLFVKRYSVPLLVSYMIFRSLIIIFSIKPGQISHHKIFPELIIFLLVALWFSIYPRQYVMHYLGDPRHKSVDFMLINLISFLLVLHQHAKNERVLSNAKAKYKILVATCIFFIFLAFRSGPDGDFVGVLKAMNQSHAYKKYMFSRFDAARYSTGKSLSVPSFSALPPNTIFVDIKEDPKAMMNICFSAYFGLKDIKLTSTD